MGVTVQTYQSDNGTSTAIALVSSAAFNTLLQQQSAQMDNSLAEQQVNNNKKAKTK